MLFFFFFQAEDGIRDRNVTGVQTCALPILRSSSRLETPGCLRRASSNVSTSRSRAIGGRLMRSSSALMKAMSNDALRSEERRVGKECRSRWWRAYEKKKSERRSAEKILNGW